MTAGGRLRTGVLMLAIAVGLLPCRATRAQPAGGVGAGSGESATVSQEVADIARRDLARLATRLNDPNAPQEARDEAAHRLISRQSPEARRHVADALINLNPGGQLAAARALGHDPRPDPAMIDPLFAVLGNNRPLTEAAARALTTFKTNPEVTTRLIAYAQGRPASEHARVTVVRAIGAMPQRRAAQYLIELLSRPDESAGARAAAAAALADLTGITTHGGDPQRWQQWWQANASKSEDQFRADLLTQRAARYDRLEQRTQSLSATINLLLREQYRAAAPAQRAELLVRFLRSEEPQVRAVAAAIVYDEALDNRPPVEPVREQMRALIGDSEAQVRAAVADAFAKINDAPAFEALLAQLAQEPEARVRGSLAKALAPINDLRAVPVLLGMLSDPSLDAATAAAEALRSLGKTARERDAALAQRAAEALRVTLEQRTTPNEAIAFREDLVNAMVPLRQEELLPLFTRMLDERRGESPEVRRLAIQGIGEIAHPQSAGVLITALGDRSERIRRAAVQALASNPALAENAWALRDLLDPTKEPSQDVRNDAWRALETVFPQLPKAQLQIWADQRFKDDPERRLIVLKALAEQQLRDKEEDGLATTRQNIAEVLMQLKEHREAAEYFRLALEYQQSRQVQEVVIQTLMAARAKALLAAREYQACVEFASQMIQKSPGTAQIFGPLIWNEAQQLRDASDFQAALDLIAAAKTMDPPLSDRYRDELASIEKEIQAKRTQQNGAPAPPGPRSAAAGGDVPLAAPAVGR